MKAEDFISTTELAKMLGISRVAVHNKIKKGEIKATKVGRNYVIDKKDLASITGKELTDEEKQEIEAAVAKTVSEYGETLKLLGDA